MKKNDLAMIILIVTISLSVSWFVGNILINTPDNRETKVEVVQAISAEFPVPSNDIFVKGYINPTELIQIGNTNNQQPFNSSN